MISWSHEKLENENRDAECIVVHCLVIVREPAVGLRRNGVGITDITAVRPAVAGNLTRVHINQVNLAVLPVEGV